MTEIKPCRKCGYVPSAEELIGTDILTEGCPSLECHHDRINREVKIREWNSKQEIDSITTNPEDV